LLIFVYTDKLISMSKILFILHCTNQSRKYEKDYKFKRAGI